MLCFSGLDVLSDHVGNFFMATPVTGLAMARSNWVCKFNQNSGSTPTQ